MNQQVSDDKKKKLANFQNDALTANQQEATQGGFLANFMKSTMLYVNDQIRCSFDTALGRRW